MNKYLIEIDREMCIGNGACLAHATKTFKLDGENKAELTGDNDLDELILRAAENCPTKAIILSNKKGQVYP